uniref:Uncharacterized protein n=1 Tax=Panagrolaimus sp. ES5 TaxID=591445 RepID=A0AC34GQL2_9BILA
MKTYLTILITVFLISCLFSEFEAKKVKGEKIKAEKLKEKVVHKHVKLQPDQPQEKSSEHHTTSKAHKVVKSKKEAEKPVDLTSETIENVEEVVEKKPFKPRPAKVLSEYEQCKLECKKKRDQVSAKEYVEQLTEELKLAKEYLATQEREAAQQNKAATNIPHSTMEIPPVGDHLEDIPAVEKPIIEVTLHQTAKDEV